MVYACVMEQRKYFNVEADDKDQMLDWLATHNMFDVDCKAKSKYDEYNEWILHSNEELVADFSIATKNEDSKTETKNESEDDFMNERMERLKTLIAESNKVMDDVVAETKRMKKEHADNLEKQYREFADKLKEYIPIFKEAKCTRKHLPVDFDSKYTIKFAETGSEDIWVEDDKAIVGWFELDKKFTDTLGCGESRESRKRAMEYIMTHLDTELFERSIAQAISDTLAERAAKADSDYKKAKEILSRD